LPQRCKICTHPQKEEIDKALLESQNITEIAKRFSVSYDSLLRHKKNHITPLLANSRKAQEIARADNLLSQVTELKDKAIAILNKAEEAGDNRTALLAIREAKGCLELLAKLLGELNEQATINILINPQWLSLRAVILQALEPYPEAKLALAKALREAEENAGR